MGLMNGKKALIFGVANERSIAWGITKAFHREGCAIGLSYAGEALKDRVTPLARQVDCDFIEPCDVGKDDQLDSLFERAKSKFGTIDVVVHAIAFAKKEDLENQFVTTSREGFRPRRERL
jgi:enoyl-[acyl-carrier protein] reductase I